MGGGGRGNGEKAKGDEWTDREGGRDEVDGEKGGGKRQVDG